MKVEAELLCWAYHPLKSGNVACEDETEEQSPTDGTEKAFPGLVWRELEEWLRKDSPAEGLGGQAI